VSKRFDNWNKKERVCMNCAISKTCKFAGEAIKMFKAKCALEEIDLDERYSVSAGIQFKCDYFMRKQED